MAGPQALLLADNDTRCTPIHILMHNESIGDMLDVLQYLAESNTSSLLAKDDYGRTPLHVSCVKEYTNTRTIKVPRLMKEIYLMSHLYIVSAEAMRWKMK